MLRIMPFEVDAIDISYLSTALTRRIHPPWYHCTNHYIKKRSVCTFMGERYFFTYPGIYQLCHDGFLCPVYIISLGSLVYELSMYPIYLNNYERGDLGKEGMMMERGFFFLSS